MFKEPVEAKLIRSHSFGDYPWEATKELNKWMREHPDLKILQLIDYTYVGHDGSRSSLVVTYLITEEMHDQEVAAVLEREEHMRMMEAKMYDPSIRDDL